MLVCTRQNRWEWEEDPFVAEIGREHDRRRPIYLVETYFGPRFWVYFPHGLGSHGGGVVVVQMTWKADRWKGQFGRVASSAKN